MKIVIHRKCRILFVLILSSNYFNLCLNRCLHVDSLDSIVVIPMVSERTLVELGDNWDNDDCAQYILLISIRGSLLNPFKTKCSWKEGHLSWVNAVVSTLINILTKMAHNVLLYFDFLLPWLKADKSSSAASQIPFFWPCMSISFYTKIASDRIGVSVLLSWHFYIIRFIFN